MVSDLNKRERKALAALATECRYADTRPGVTMPMELRFVTVGADWIGIGAKTIATIEGKGYLTRGVVPLVGGEGFRITQLGLEALAKPARPASPKR